ncbi:MAG TPA: hypothetical protein VN048_09135 [Verrucomicrobiae bacterium]|jgi:hypothetical protein|nr:hypothetical protein [Verrucomicrobiae bacterium]
MESNWAAENLQTIRTLMERSAVYRRALAPVMIFVGMTGVIGAAAGWWLKIEDGSLFASYWMAISVVAIAGAFMLVRRQALKSAEPFWSPPTRRIAQAMLPALLIGCVFGLIAAVRLLHHRDDPFRVVLVLIWGLLYGLALNAAGFFMPRGIRWFGWAFIIVGLGLFLQLDSILEMGADLPHLLMGILFGLSHLAYGIYLYFTEPRKNESLS